MKNIVIFDLDGTCIDSSHRQVTRPDGTLDLEKWFEKMVPEHIMRDKVMPLGKQIRKRMVAGDYVIVCTARSFTDADLAYLEKHGMQPHKILARPMGNMEPDAQLKEKQLRQFLSLKQFQGKNTVMFDDAKSVRSTLRKLLNAVIHPDKINPRIA